MKRNILKGRSVFRGQVLWNQGRIENEKRGGETGRTYGHVSLLTGVESLL